jgi:probable rRNA maturation factor
MDDEEDPEGVILLGDVILSTQKIIEQAEDFGHSLEREMIYLTVHSMLHLLGYDHMTDDDKEEMRDREKEVMKYLQLFK